MPTKLSIWNEALLILGRMPTNSTTGTDDATRALADAWTRSPTSVLEEQDWNSAITRVQLQRTVATPAHGYAYFYQMPNNWAKIVHLNDTGEEHDPFEDWAEEAGKIATNAEAVYLWYVSDVTDTAIGGWSQALADYIAADMALRTAPRLAPKLLEYAEDRRKKKRRLAMSTDARNNPPHRHTPGSWIRARLGGLRNATEQGR